MGLNSKMSEKFNLRFNKYQENIANNFKRLTSEEDFFDVTLVSDDQKHFSAHKLVLSSCSVYFKNILKQTKHSHPLLCLDGIGSNELNDVLHYIYNGEVDVYQEHIDRFLGIAFRLQLEGLMNNTTSDEIYSLEVDYQNLSSKISGAITPRNLSSPIQPSDSRIKPEKEKCRPERFESVIKTKSNYSKAKTEKHNNYSDINMTSIEIEQEIDENYERNKDDGLYYCKLCIYKAKSKSHTREHMDTHFDFKYNCCKCDKILNSKNALRHHDSIHRKQDQTSSKDMDINSIQEIQDDKLDHTKESQPLIKQDEQKLNALLTITERKADGTMKLDVSAKVVEDHTNENLSLSEIDEQMANHMEMTNGGYICLVCQYSSKHKDHVREHLDKHIKFTYNCNLCENSYGSKNAYRRHIAMHRKASLEVNGSI